MLVCWHRPSSSKFVRFSLCPTSVSSQSLRIITIASMQFITVRYHIYVFCEEEKNWYLGVEQGEGGWQGWGLWDGAGDDHARGGGLDQDRLQQLDQQVVGEHVDSKGCFKTCSWNFTSTWTFTRVLYLPILKLYLCWSAGNWCWKLLHCRWADPKKSSFLSPG